MPMIFFLVLVWRKSIDFWWKYKLKANDLYIFFPSDLDIWPSDLQFAHQ